MATPALGHSKLLKNHLPFIILSHSFIQEELHLVSCKLPVLLSGCESCTLTRDLRRRFNSSGTRFLQIILGCRWSDFLSNEQWLRETQVRFVTCIIRERQLRLYGHVARFPEADPAHQILSARESREWRGQWADHVPRGCSRLISISRRWGWARHLPEGWPDRGPWSTGGKWTQRCAALVHAPIPDLT